MNIFHCSIGIIVYNEAENIGRLLQAIRKQELQRVEIDRIIVVSSASKDGTDEIVKSEMQYDSRIELIVEQKRNGKSAAINKFLQVAASEYLIIESGDTLPAKDTIEKLVTAFEDSSVGACGGRPVPENLRKGISGHLVHILWEMHHLMALRSPKLGEMIAFRNVIEAIPSESAVDEASIEAQIRERGYKLKYEPEAIVYNKGPENLKEYISQRRRIASGHLWLKANQNYAVASQDSGLLLNIILKKLTENPGELFYLILTVKIEALSRFLGWWDLHILHKNPFKWDIARTSKNIKREV
jgi:poly-beta-1,6-N-acetyl-D-glucosamine synthase